MATRFEVLVLATEDDCSGQSISKNREGIDAAVHAYRGKTRFSTEGFEHNKAVMRSHSRTRTL